MASSLLSLNSVTIRTGPPRSDPNRRRSSPNNWWSPVFGWSSDPDYIGSDSKPEDTSGKNETRSESDLEPKQARSRFAPGGFTEEKAKQLRMMTSDTSSFHDVMYHSAIASRLASDFKGRSDR